MNEYHTPDPTWNTWCDSYEVFVENWVVKGRFHPSVPENVIKNFTVAEYIMAHSWYLYPMYDEAMNTIVGIIEWVVKHKCTDLEIPVRFTDDIGNIKEKTLQELISELHKKEPSKQLNAHLEWARHLRNTISHPTGYGFAGGTIVHAVREGVNILNQLFIPETELNLFLLERQKMASHIKSFSKGAWVLEYNGSSFLVEKCKVTRAVKAKGSWHYLLSAYPLYKNLTASLQQHSYQPMHLLDVIEIKVKQKTLEAKLSTGQPAFIKPLTLESHKVAYHNHTSAWQKADRIDKLTYQHSCLQDIEMAEGEMLYRYLLDANHSPQLNHA